MVKWRSVWSVRPATLAALGPKAAAGCDVSGLDGGGRVLDLGGGDVARGLASLPDRCLDSDGRAAGSSYDGCPGGGRTKGTKKMLDRRKVHRLTGNGFGRRAFPQACY